jgi:biphenyl 2,3-dioxygenase ferredoxin reductase subunit
MAAQLDECGVDWTEGRVTALAATADGHAVELADGRRWRARCVCLATGTRPRHWPVALAGGRWVHRDARSLPARLDGLRAAVVGGGEAALDTALSLRDRGAGVELWVRGRRLRASAVLRAEAQAAGVQPIWSTEPVRARRQGQSWELTSRDGRRLVADELVVCIGRERRDELLAAVQPQPDSSDPLVYRPGLFVAGDLIRGRDRYAATAMGDGQRAAVACIRHLSGADPPAGRSG